MVRPLRVPVADLSEGRQRLPGDAGRYAARVHRRQLGDPLLLIDVEASVEAHATIVAVSGSSVEVVVERVGRARGCAQWPLVLVQALATGDKPDRAVREATVLGATRLVLFPSERSVPRLNEGAARRARWRRIAVEAARQSGRGDIPSIEVCGDLLAVIASLPETGARWLLTPGEGQWLVERLRACDLGGSLCLMVGPEGGWSQAEHELAQSRGFLPTQLGPWTLRTETAVTVALGVVLAARAVGLGNEPAP